MVEGGTMKVERGEYFQWKVVTEHGATMNTNSLEGALAFVLDSEFLHCGACGVTDNWCSTIEAAQQCPNYG